MVPFSSKGKFEKAIIHEGIRVVKKYYKQLFETAFETAFRK